MILAITLSVIGMPLPARAGSDEAPASARHLTLNGHRLSHLLNTTAVTGQSLGVLEQGAGQISGVALDAEGDPLADHPVELLGVSEQGAATSVVARTTTSAAGGFSFPELGQGRYVVELRVHEQVIATSGPITLAEGGATFVQVGGLAVQPSTTDGWWSQLSTPGKLLVGAGVYVGVGLMFAFLAGWAESLG